MTADMIKSQDSCTAVCIALFRTVSDRSGGSAMLLTWSRSYTPPTQSQCHYMMLRCHIVLSNDV